MALYWRKPIHRSKIDLIPASQGVYKLYWVYGNVYRNERILQYIGESSNLRRRIKGHLEHRWWNWVEIALTKGMSRNQRLNQEYGLIQRRKPPYNIC